MFPFFCWVAQTARLYLTDMGSMCAPFLNSTRGTSIPALELHVQAKNKLDGRRLTLQGLDMGPPVGTSHLWVTVYRVPTHLLEEVLPV